MDSSGAVALWRCGAVALWRCGAVALWRCGAVALWRCSGAVATVSASRIRELGSNPMLRCRPLGGFIQMYECLL